MVQWVFFNFLAVSFSITASPYRSSYQGRQRSRWSQLFGGRPRRPSRAQTARLQTSSAVANSLPLYHLPSRSLQRNVSSIPRSSKKVRFHFGSSVIIGGLSLVSVLLVLLYLAHFNKVATKGYDLKRLQRSQDQLMVQNEIRTMRLTEAQSLQNIIVGGKVSNMRRPREVMYVRGESAIAKID